MKVIPPATEFYFLELSVFLFGLIFGSFLNVCIYRLPRGLSVVSPRSACPNCKSPVQAYDNIPVLSWVLLRGKCRNCKAPISPRYLVVELLTGIFFVASVCAFGFTGDALKYCVFSFLILGLIFTDADLKLLPDTLTLPGIALGVIFSYFVPLNGIAPLVFGMLPGSIALPSMRSSWRLLSLADSVIGALVAALIIWSIGAIYKKVRGIEGMGFGDVKLMGMVGAFLGIKLALLTLMAGSLMGSIAGVCAMFSVWVRRLRRHGRRTPARIARERAWRSTQLVMRHYQMPFGVFLGIAALGSAFFGPALVRWYEDLFR